MNKFIALCSVLCLAGCVGGGVDGEVGSADGALRPGSFSQNYQFRGASADANFYGYSEDGCSWWGGSIYGGANVNHVVRGRPVSSAFTYAYLNGYNWCTGQNFNGWGSTESVSIDGLNSAHLSVPLTVSSSTCTWVDCAGSTDPRCAPPTCDPGRPGPWCCDPLDPSCPPPPPPPPGYYECTNVDQTGNFVADITGVGDTSRGINMSNYSSGPYRSVSRTNGSWRSANATGSLVIGGRNFLAGATGYGSLSNNTTSSHTFYRY